jgi:elongation factor Ts
MISKLWCPKLIVVSASRVHRQFSSVNISATMVKELREKSGAGMMDCKKALGDPSVAGDMQKAIDWLRTKGMVRASNSATRSASEGVVAIYTQNTNGKQVATLIEVNSETDFVSRNKDFHAFVKQIALTTSAHSLNADTSIDTILNFAVPGNTRNLKDLLIDAISVIR